MNSLVVGYHVKRRRSSSTSAIYCLVQGRMKRRRGLGKAMTTRTFFLAHARIVPGLLYRYCIADRVSSVDRCGQDALLVSTNLYSSRFKWYTFFLHRLRNSSKGATPANRRSGRYKSMLAYGRRGSYRHANCDYKSNGRTNDFAMTRVLIAAYVQQVVLTLIFRWPYVPH